MALKRLCIRCNKNLIDYKERHCAECSTKVREEQKQRHKDYKKNRTDEREQEFYNSKEWIKTRELIKQDYKGLCLYSYYILNEVIFCDVVHHIIELKDKDGWELKVSEDNLIPLGDSVHKQIHILYLKSKESKRQIQEMLRSLKERWKKEVCSGVK